jgi:site-specific DNA-methyltransferase (cytosine-N4-specific)
MPVPPHLNDLGSGTSVARTAPKGRRLYLSQILPFPDAPRVRILDWGKQGLCDFFAGNHSHPRDSAIFAGDAGPILEAVPSQTFQACVTSPPYWSLRDYRIPGQIGLESSLDSYIQNLVTIFERVHRVLRDDGTLWLNIGDSYTSGGRTWRAPDKKNPVRAMEVRPPTPDGLKPKDLIGVPWRLAFALQSAGWYLRADVIWNKPNCQPESVKDRPTRCHEYIFLFSKSGRYSYHPSSLRGPNGRNLRTVWDINTQACYDAHFATFPPALVESCVALSTRPGDMVLDPFLGSGTTGKVCLENERRFVGIELNPDYIKIAERRFKATVIRG